VLGEGEFMPGFEEALYGMSRGESREFSLTTPKDYYKKDIAGAELSFSVTMREVSEAHTPELTDTFAKSVGNFSDLAALRASITDGLMEEKSARIKEKARLSILRTLVRETPFEYPPLLKERELTAMSKEFSQSLMQMGIDEAQYLAQIKKSKKELVDEWESKADERVRIALILRAIAQSEGVGVDEEELEEKMNELLNEVRTPKEAKHIDFEALKERTRTLLRNEKVLALLEESAVYE
jgi:trigger factor